MPNPNPTYKMRRMYNEEMAESPLSVRLTAEMDAQVRSRPNRTEWLREAIAEKLAREQKDLSV